jgi:hypothetical protein
MMQLEHGFVSCWNLNTSEVRSEIVESFEMWRWRNLEISWSDRVKRKEVVYGVKEGNNILNTERV